MPERVYKSAWTGGAGQWERGAGGAGARSGFRLSSRLGLVL